MAREDEVLGQLVELLGGTVDIDAFEEWFVDATWENDSPLVRAISGVLAESAGLTVPEAVILSDLEEIAREFFVFGDPRQQPPVVRQRSASESVMVGATVGSGAGISLRGDPFLLTR